MLVSILQRVADIFFAVKGDRLNSLTFWLFHGYFILGIFALGWGLDMILLGYFLEALVEIFFSSVAFFYLADSKTLKNLLAFVWKSALALIFSFAFIIVIDFLFKEKYRSDLLLVKIFLTLDSLMQGAFPDSAEYLVNGLTLETRNEFLRESIWLFLLPIFRHGMNFLPHKKELGRFYPSKLGILQFWFLFGISILFIQIFHIPYSFAIFLILARILFDYLANHTDKNTRERRIKNFLWQQAIFGFSILIISDIGNLTGRLVCFFTPVISMLAFSTIFAEEKKSLKDIPIWERLLLGAEFSALLSIAILPSLASTNSSDTIRNFTELKNRNLCAHGIGCSDYGEKVFQTKSSWPSIEDAISLLEKDCERRNKKSCYVLGSFFVEEIGGTKIKSGLEYLENSCAELLAEACNKLGKKQIALDLAGKSCIEEKDCLLYARLIEEFSGCEKAIPVYSNECRKDNPLSCGYLASCQKKLNLLKESAATEIKACRLGNIDACYKSAMVFENGQGVEKNTEHARSFYSIACDHFNHPEACFRQGILIKKYGSYGVIDDLSNWEAAQKTQKACKLGLNEACKM